MNTLRLLLACVSLLLAGSALAAEPLDEDTSRFLAAYEQIRAALADDQLSAAQTAAKALPEAKAIAEAKSISAARKAFKALSGRAVTIARGQPGYFIAHCTMFPGGADWVQTTDQVSNPYWGKSMPHCGEIVK